MNPVLAASGRFFFKYRNGLFPIVFALLFLFTRPALFLNNEALDTVVVLAGSAIALAGTLFRMFVIGYAYIKRGGKNKQVYADNLVVEGIYAHSRNPMYVGNFMIMLGIGLVYGSPWIYFAVIPFFIYVYLTITMVEENYLREKFKAQYLEYERTVPRFWPNFKGLGETLRGWKFDWKKAIRKDHGTAFGTMVGLVFVEIWKLISIYGFEAKEKQITSLAFLFIPIVAFYIGVRLLRKTPALNSPE